MRHVPARMIIAALALGFPLAGRLAAEVAVPPVISSHMVLQRNVPAPLWGTAAPQEPIVIKFRDQNKQATADAKGHWMIKLDPLKAGGPDTLTISGKSNTLTLDDVLVGEVWLGSGQSNMDQAVDNYRGNAALVALADAGPYPKLRLLTSGSKSPWLESTPQNNHKFSAQGFAFAVALQKKLDVPVGMMIAAVGGTCSGRWIPPEALQNDPAIKAAIAAALANPDYPKALDQYKEAKARYDAQAKELKAQKKDPGKPPENPGIPGKPYHWPEQSCDLYVDRVQPLVPFAFRGVLWDQGESDVNIAAIDQYTLMGALIRGWRKAWGQGDFPFLYVQKPSGDGCALDPKNPINIGARPFERQPAQIPEDRGDGFFYTEERVSGISGGLYREMFFHIASYPNTFMVTTFDLTPGIHPDNKFGYGNRAANIALAAAYGAKEEIYGPVYRSCKNEGGSIRIAFDHIGSGLTTGNNQKLQGFLIAGEDRLFHWGEAAIDGQTVVVSSKQVPNPKSVRYAWSWNCPYANLFSKDGLPALTFRTDTWER